MKNKSPHFYGTISKNLVTLSVISQLISQIFVAGFSIVTLKITTNSLGTKQYGLYATIFAFVTTFSLLTDLGLNAITAREIAKHPTDANSIVGYNMGLRLALCVVMIPLIFILSFAFYPHASSELRDGLIFFSIYLIFDSIKSVALAYFGAKVRNDISALVNGAQQFVMLLFAGLAALWGLGLNGFIAVYILSNVIGASIALYMIRKHIKIRPRFNFHRSKSILAMSLSLGIIQLVNMLYLKADSILLSVLKSTFEVGIYGVAYMLILAFLTVPSFIMSALIPSMATSSIEDVGAIVQKAFHYMAIFACLLAVGGFVVRNDIVQVVSSSNFLAAAVPFSILALASAFSYLNNVFGFASVALNKHHKMIYVSVASLVLNIGLNFILIPRYSVNGAAWSTVISEVAALAGVYSIFYRETGVRVSFLPLLKPLIASITLLAIMTLLHPLYSMASSLLNLVISSLIILIIYPAVLWVLKALPEEIVNYILLRLPKRDLK